MKIENGALVSEIGEWPGCYGDSCANTARHYLICRSLELDVTHLNLKQFRNDHGYLRHPLIKDVWGEDDFSGDQALPLFLAFKLDYPEMAQEMKQRIKDNWWRTGNNRLASPALISELNNNSTMRNFCLRTQAKIFKLSFRWSDATHWFEPSSGSSADYLNWMFSALQAPVEVRRVVQPGLLIEKVSQYFATEPNHEVILKGYTDMIVRNFY